MTVQTAVRNNNVRPKILIIDDESDFRKGLAQQLSVREFEVLDADSGEAAIKIVRHAEPEVIILDQKMPGMDGIQALKEIKKIKPEVQVIMHTGHGSIEAARLTGKHDVFKYLEKPCPLEDLIRTVNEALDERVHALARHEIPAIQKFNWWQRVIGAHNARPGFIALGVVIFCVLAFMPTPKSLEQLLKTPKQQIAAEAITGYADYRKMEKGQSISGFYAAKAKLYADVKTPDGQIQKKMISPEQAAMRAKVMVGILVVAALFWATGAMPIGITALLVGALMYLFGVLNANDVAQAYAKDSVVFIFSVLALAAAISKTGLDRRIGILLLGTSTSLVKFGLIFAPLLAVSAAFLSEHALVAFIAPILMMVFLISVLMIVHLA